MKICEKCKKTFPNRININGEIKNISKRKYCLECSPFGKHNTKDLNKDTFDNKQKCIKCKKIKNVEDFYKRYGTNNRYTSYCKSCLNKIKSKELVEKKKKAVNYLGGKCKKCGIISHYAIYDFHHRDPSKKKYAIGQNYQKRWKELKKEIDKCDLLCANCHRLEHVTMRDHIN